MNKIPKTRREREVWEACNELWHEMQLADEPITTLTGERLRNKLVELGYKRGAQNQLYQYRSSWLVANKLDDWQPEPDKEELLTERVTQIVSYVMKELRKESDAEIEKTQTACDTQLAKATSDAEQIQHQHNALIEEHRQQQDIVHTLDQEKEQQKMLIAQLQKDLAVAEEREHHLNEALGKEKKNSEAKHFELTTTYNNDMRKLETQLESLEQSKQRQLDELKTIHEDYRQGVIVEIDQLKTKVTQLIQQLGDAGHQLQQLRQEKKNIATELLRQTSKLELIEQTYQKSIKNHESMKAEMKNSIHEGEKIIASLQGELSLAKSQLTLHQQQSKEGQQLLLTYQERVLKLEQTLKQAQSRQVLHDDTD